MLDATVTPPVEDNVDNFAAAFEELSKLGEKPVTAEAIAGKPPVATPPVETPPVETPPVAEDEDGDLPNPETQIAEAEAAAAAAKEPPPAPTLEAALDKLADRLAPKEPAPAPKPAPAPQPDFAPDQIAFISNYIKEFPDVARAEEMIRQNEYRHLTNYVFGEVQKVLGPIQQVIESLTTRTHLQDLEGEVEDYADVREKVITWIGEQPDYLQAAYNNVVQHGTVKQVADLISRYRTETGAPAATQQAPTSGQKDTELPTAAKQAAAKLAPVSSKRSQVVSSPSDQDFDGAFAAFAGQT